MNGGVVDLRTMRQGEQPFTVNREDVGFKGWWGKERRAETVEAPIKDSSRWRTACVCSRCFTMHEGMRWSRVQRLYGAFRGFTTAVNQGLVPMHELLRTELRNIRVKRAFKKETCFRCDSRIVTMALLTKGGDGSKEDAVRSLKALSACPSESCVPLSMQVENTRSPSFVLLVQFRPWSPQAEPGRAVHSCELYQSLPLLCVTLAAALRGGKH